MSQFPSESERLAAINAVIQGDMRQLRFFLDEIQFLGDRVDVVEGVGSHGRSPKQLAAGINPVSVPGDDAKAAEIRDAVVDIAETLNLLIERLNGE